MVQLAYCEGIDMTDKDDKSEKNEVSEKKSVDDNKTSGDTESLRRSFEFTVNGIKIDTPHQKLVAHDILELAEKRDAIPGKPEDCDLKGDKGKYGWDDWVDLEEDNLFITIPKKSTPVA